MSDLMMYHIFNNVSRMTHEYSVYFTFSMLITSYLWMYKQHYSISRPRKPSATWNQLGREYPGAIMRSCCILLCEQQIS